MFTQSLNLPILISLATSSFASADETIQRIGIIGCHKQNEPAPALARYIEAKPDLLLWIGDNVYADTKKNPQFIQLSLDRLAAQEGFSELRKQVPFVVTWDDHDYGYNDAGKNYVFKKESKEIFREFWQMQEHIPADRDGIYHSRYFETNGHKLQMILLDPRYNRDDPGPSADTLGENQWKWLAEELRKPADLRLLVSGYQVLLDAESGSETWALFPTARDRLFKTIREAKAEHLVFLTGDQHYGEVCRSRNVLGYDAIELQFSGLNQIEKPEFNSTRVSAVSKSKHSYAMLDIQWEKSKTDAPHLLFQIHDATTKMAEVVYRVNFSEIESPKP